MTDSQAGTEVIRVDATLVDVVAQLLWVADPDREVMRGPIDGSGLVILVLDTPLPPRAAASFEIGLDALLAEPWARARSIYLREVRDASGRRRELGAAVAPSAWQGGPRVVGPFEDAAEAERWSATIAPPHVGDVIVIDGRYFVDVFAADPPQPT